MKKRILALLLCLVLLLGVLPIPAAAAENPFVDVSESDYFYDAVLWAYETGVTVGVDCVTAFSQSVYTTYSTAVIRPLLEKLLAGENMVSAVAEVKKEYGKDDRYWTKEDGKGEIKKDHDPAELAIKGDKSMRIHDQLYNGDFETKLMAIGAGGKLYAFAKPASSWRWAGEARPVSRLGDYGVYGSYAAYISTGGNAYANHTESLICQSILIPENATTLSFCYRIFTEEFAKKSGTPRNDHFYAALLDANGNSLKNLLNIGVLSSRSLFRYSGKTLNAGQDCYVMNGWYKKTVNVSAFRGKVVNLCFWVRDANGNAYDTAALIDQITIS